VHLRRSGQAGRRRRRRFAEPALAQGLSAARNHARFSMHLDWDKRPRWVVSRQNVVNVESRVYVLDAQLGWAIDPRAHWTPDSLIMLDRQHFPVNLPK
jgi:hypothetical protein